MIEFVGLSDRDRLLNEDVVVNLCTFIVKNQNENKYLLILAEVITECHDVSSYTEKIIHIYEEYDSDDEKVTELIGLLYKFYSYTQSSSKKLVDAGNMRGALLERLTAVLVMRRVFPELDDSISFPLKQNSDRRALHVSCNVKIDDANWKTKNPIDIGAFDSFLSWRGVCYECKISIEKMEKSDEMILSELYQKGNQNLREQNDSLEVGVVSFLHTGSAKYIFKYIESSADLKIYGRDNIFEL